MPDTETAGAWRGHELIDRDGEKIGKIAEVYLDQHTGEPAWVTVKTGLFGNRHTLVPIGDALSEGKIVRVPFDKEHVEESPNMDPDTDLSASEERELYDHYGVDYSSEGSGAQVAEHGVGAGNEPSGEHEHEHGSGQELRGEHEQGAAEAGQGSGPHGAVEPSDARHRGEDPGTREHDRDEHARDESRGTRHEEAGGAAAGSAGRVAEEPVGGGRGETRLRLKRYVVTDEIRVPVQREEVRLERDGDGEGAGPERRP